MRYRYDLKYKWFFDDWAEDGSGEGGGMEETTVAASSSRLLSQRLNSNLLQHFLLLVCMVNM